MSSSGAQLTCLFLLLVFLAACSSKPPLTQQQQLQSDWQTLSQQSRLSTASLSAFSDQAQRQREWQLVWQSQLLLCQMYKQHTSKLRACDKALYAVNLLQPTETKLFQTQLIRYMHLNDLTALASAESLANTQLQKAQLLLAQDKIPSPTLVANINPQSSEYGQYLYLLGKRDNDVNALAGSVDLFNHHKQFSKAAEVLFLQAKLQFQVGDRHNALASASEALLILDNLENREAFNMVKEWYDARLSAR